MLYVIDQRLKAQSISLEKSAQGNRRESISCEKIMKYVK